MKTAFYEDLINRISKDDVAENVTFQLTSREWFEEKYQPLDPVFITYFGMKMIFRYRISGSESFVITKRFAEAKDISETFILENAVNNVDMEGFITQPMGAFLGISSDGDGTGVMVMTNDHNMFGAAALFYPDQIKKYADKVKSNLYVIPSSTHEILLLPENKIAVEEGAIKGMIMAVNNASVAPEDRLSNDLFYYSRRDNRISILA